jgi:hypothetical protein
MKAAAAAQASAAKRPPTQGPLERRDAGNASAVLAGARMVAVAIDECGVVDILFNCLRTYIVLNTPTRKKASSRTK